MNLSTDVALERLEKLLSGLLAALPNVLIALLVFMFFWFLAGLIRRVTHRSSQRHGRPSNVALVLSRLAAGVAIVLGVLVSLTIIFPSISPADLFGFLGVTSVAIGFALRDVLQNLLAGIILLITQPFRIGDQIIVGDSEGTVENIQVRATIIRTYDNRQVVIPNSDLFTDRVTVNTAYDKRRLQYDVGIGFGDDIGRAKQLILEAMRGLPEVLEDPAPEVLVVDLAESSVNLRVRWWIAPPRRRDALVTRDAVLQAVKEKLLANGIDLPFPTRQVLFHDQTEVTDGDRRAQREGWPAGSEAAPQPRWKVLGEKQGGQDRRS